MITFAAITPHPPIIVPGIGSSADLKEVERTVLAMEKLGREIASAKPAILVIISPHAPIDPYSFGVNVRRELEGSLADFGFRKKFRFRNNPQLGHKLLYACEMNNDVPIQKYEAPLDHGMLVPLSYLARKVEPMIVPLSFSFLDLAAHYSFGELLGKICQEEKRDVAIIASGDLSHRLTPDAPSGYSPHGAEFDRQLIRLLAQRDVHGMVALKERFIDEAGECGLRSITILLGALKKTPWRFDEYSYEGPFGVGYLVARLL